MKKIANTKDFRQEPTMQLRDEPEKGWPKLTRKTLVCPVTIQEIPGDDRHS